MNKFRYLLLGCLVQFIGFNAYAQFEDVLTTIEVYVDYIASVQFGHSQIPLSAPIIDLGSNGVLKLEFDDLEGEFKNYTYHLRHCDKDWYFSDLEEIEYLDGFNGEEVDEFTYSSNAYSDYTNYQVFLPNEDINWTISGNYLLVIYDEDLQIPVLTRRFIVSENAVSALADFVRPKEISYLQTHQELEVILNMRDFQVFRPQEEIFVTVIQNGNHTNAYTNVTNNFARGDVLYFNDFNQQVAFPALKEFRSVDIRSLNFRSEFVKSIDRNDEGTTVLLDLGRQRTRDNYRSERDANGGFVIENFDLNKGRFFETNTITGGDGIPRPERQLSNEVFDSDRARFFDSDSGASSDRVSDRATLVDDGLSSDNVASEYADVIFSLEVDRPFLEEVYVVGAFNDWKARDQFRMVWDADNSIYLCKAKLKQGYYDYMFAVQDENGYMHIEDIEGSWYETENVYQIITYYREIGAQFDRVIDVAILTTNPNGLR